MYISGREWDFHWYDLSAFGCNIPRDIPCQIWDHDHAGYSEIFWPFGCLYLLSISQSEIEILSIKWDTAQSCISKWDSISHFLLTARIHLPHLKKNYILLRMCLLGHYYHVHSNCNENICSVRLIWHITVEIWGNKTRRTLATFFLFPRFSISICTFVHSKTTFHMGYGRMVRKLPWWKNDGIMMAGRYGSSRDASGWVPYLYFLAVFQQTAWIRAACRI